MPVIPFKYEHFELMHLRDQETERLDLDPGSRAKIAALAMHGHGGTILHDGRVIGIIGFYELWPGNLEIWAFPSIYVPDYPLVWLRTCRHYLRTLEDMYVLRRMQTTSLNDPLHIRWMQFLGFTQETEKPMKNYFVNGADALMWGKVYEEA